MGAGGSAPGSAADGVGGADCGGAATARDGIANTRDNPAATHATTGVVRSAQAGELEFKCGLDGLPLERVEDDSLVEVGAAAAAHFERERIE